MYGIYMILRTLNGRIVEMEKVESVFEAEQRCNLYKKKNSKEDFMVINEDNKDLEYET